MNSTVAIIAPIAARYDAISAAAAENFRALSTAPDLQPAFLTAHNELALPARVVGSVDALLADDVFRRADLLLYHFGIYHPFHDAMLVGNGHARQVAVFHNITPPGYVGPQQRDLIDRSLRQAHNLRHVDEIWADSAFNAQDLAKFGVDPDVVRVVPLAVDRPAPGRLRDKLPTGPAGALEFLFVGRLVASKGIRDLIEAVALARPRIAAPLRIRLAGNTAFSDAAYLAACRARIADLGLHDCFRFVETPDDEALCRLYAAAQVLCIPSFHEGFCVPVIEGLRAGCIPVGYASGNIPNAAGGLGRLVARGDVAALADALAEIAAGLLAAARTPAAAALPLDSGLLAPDDFDAAARAHVATFEPGRLASIKIGHVRRLLPPATVSAPVPLPAPPPAAAEPIHLPAPRHRRAAATLRQLPGATGALALLRRRLPHAYHWLAHRYAGAPRPTSPATAPALPPTARRPPAPPSGLSADEQALFARIAFAATARRRLPTG